MSRWPIPLLAGDSIHVSRPDGTTLSFAVGEPTTFNSPEDAEFFYANSKEVERRTYRLPPFWLLFGGTATESVQIVRVRTKPREAQQ